MRRQRHRKVPDRTMTEQEKSNLHQISMELGGLKSAVELMTSIWQQQDAAATVGRRALHEKVEIFRQEVGVEMASMGLRVDRVVDQLGIIEPAVKNFREKELRAEGARQLGVKLWAAML